MAVAAHLKSMDLLMFARASEGLTHVRGMVVCFLAFVIGGAFLVLGLYVATSTTNVMGRIFCSFAGCCMRSSPVPVFRRPALCCSIKRATPNRAL